MKRKLLSLVLSLVLVVVFAAGCNSKTNTNGTPTATPTSQPTQVVNKPMYPVVTDGSITLKYWLPIHNNAIKFIKSYAENEAYQAVQQKTGIKIDFIHPASGQEKEQFNLMMASGDLPDMIQSADLYAGGETKGMNDGAFLDLTPYLQKDAPDYYKLIAGDPEIKREIYTDDGKVPAFYKITVTPVPPWCRPIIRKDWMDEFGMKEPTTLDEFEAYLKAVKDKKPGVVPFMLPKHGQGSDANQVEVFYGAFNLLPGWFVSDGKVRFGNADSKLKDYLTLMNKWYNLGYISKDFPALDSKQVWAEFDSNKVGMYIDSVDSSRSRVLPLNIPIVSTPYPRVNKDDKLHTVLASWPKSGDVTVVSATSKHKDEAIKFLNYAYTQEGSMIYNYGIEGKMYTMVNGKPIYTDYVLNNPKFSTENANYILRIHFAPKLLTGTPMEFNPTIAKSPEAVAFRMKWNDDKNVDNAYRMPPLSLTADENTKRAEIMTNVNTYADEMILKFIIGTEPLSNFDKYMDQLKKYGMDEAVKITQAAYDRYMKK